jgi:hypothetical protein
MRRELALKPAYVLRLIRDGVHDWDTLCVHFGCDPKKFISGPSGASYLMHTLESLSDVGLVDLNQRIPSYMEHLIRGGSTEELTFSVSKRWMELQSTLGISLTELSQSSPDSIRISPFFGRPNDVDVAEIFVMMAFRRELEPVYEDHLVTVAKGLKLKIRRADDFFGAHQIMQDRTDGATSPIPPV